MQIDRTRYPRIQMCATKLYDSRANGALQPTKHNSQPRKQLHKRGSTIEVLLYNFRTRWPLARHSPAFLAATTAPQCSREASYNMSLCRSCCLPAGTGRTKAYRQKKTSHYSFAKRRTTVYLLPRPTQPLVAARKGYVPYQCTMHATDWCLSHRRIFKGQGITKTQYSKTTCA